ncbi:MAG: hypothetical protein ABR599_05115 [Gemmatimonadota bacterium]
MKILQVVPVANEKIRLKKLLKDKERELRGKTTFSRKSEGTWVHVKHPGSIVWSEGTGGFLIAEIRPKRGASDGQLLQAFIGYLDRHLGPHIDSISIYYR